jgi:hypothetical protein
LIIHSLFQINRWHVRVRSPAVELLNRKKTPVNPDKLTLNARIANIIGVTALFCDRMSGARMKSGTLSFLDEEQR